MTTAVETRRSVLNSASLVNSGNEYEARLVTQAESDRVVSDREFHAKRRELLAEIEKKTKLADWWRGLDFSRMVEFLRSLAQTGEIEPTFEDVLAVIEKPWLWEAEFDEFESAKLAASREANDADDRRKMMV